MLCAKEAFPAPTNLLVINALLMPRSLKIDRLNPPVVQEYFTVDLWLHGDALPKFLHFTDKSALIITF